MYKYNISINRVMIKWKVISVIDYNSAQSLYEWYSLYTITAKYPPEQIHHL